MSELSTPVPPGAAAPPQTVGALLRDAVRAHRGTALRTAGHPHGVSFEELEVAGSEIARGLAHLGVAPGDRVAILANTRQEWTLADVGALWAGAVVVPVYHTSSAEETEYVLAHSGARVVFCEDAAQLAKVDSVRERCPQLEHRILLCDSAPHVMTVTALRARGRDVDEALLAERAAAVGHDDVATLVYTSGTTGPPKGCMLTHANVLATVEMYRVRLDLRGDMSVYMFLPLAHALARVTQFVALAVGGTIVFWRGDPKRIVEELAEVAPTHFPSVPRVFEKVHRAAVGAVEDQHRLRRLVFTWALGEGARARARDRTGRRAGPLAGRRHALADRLVLSKVRGAFGDGLRVAVTGAAPIGREILEFFDACGVLVLEGYGLTETCAAATLNTEGERRFGTVGRPLPGSEVRVLDDGELLVRGPQVFSGYYRDEESTAAVLEDGWLATGDLGAVDPDGFVRITGRKKDLIITSNGKNVSPSNIEELLRETRWISQAVVFGDNRPYLVALLTIDPDEAARLADHVGAPSSDVAALSRHPGVRAALQEDVDAVNERLARIEQIKRFELLDHDLSQSAGELTPTLKIKRPVLQEHYGDRVDELYRRA